MNIRHTPGTVAAPFGSYSHAVEVPEGSRLLYISGEVGALPDGTVPEGIGKPLIGYARVSSTYGQTWMSFGHILCKP